MNLSGPGEAVKKYVMPDGNSSKKAQLWIGEGAMAYDSGLHGLTDTFHGSLWYANILGALTKTKPLPHSVLLGGISLEEIGGSKSNRSYYLSSTKRFG